MTMQSRKGMWAIQDELDEIGKRFARVGDEAAEAVKPIAAQFNISDETSGAYADELAARLFGGD